jgi:cytochrome c oxidase subunit 1
MMRWLPENVSTFGSDIDSLFYVITVCAFFLVLSQIPFVVNFIYCLFAGKKADRNPWQANILDWVAPSPPPHGNLGAIPVVYRGAYEYSSPEVSEDYLPQDRQIA